MSKKAWKSPEFYILDSQTINKNTAGAKESTVHKSYNPGLHKSVYLNQGGNFKSGFNSLFYKKSSAAS